jgi:hypothetical protein
MKSLPTMRSKVFWIGTLRVLYMIAILTSPTSTNAASYRKPLDPAREFLGRTVEGCSTVLEGAVPDWTYSWSGLCAGPDHLALGPGTLTSKPPKTVPELSGYVMIFRGWMLDGRFIGEQFITKSGVANVDLRPIRVFSWNGESYIISGEATRTVARKTFASVAFRKPGETRNYDVMWFEGSDFGEFRIMSGDGNKRTSPHVEIEKCSARKCPDLWERGTKEFFDNMEAFIAEATPEIEAAKQSVDLAAARLSMDRFMIEKKKEQALREVTANTSARQFDMAQATRESRPVKTPNIDQLARATLGK